MLRPVPDPSSDLSPKGVKVDMHDFMYKNGELYCEDVKVSDIAEKVGTPFYLYSHKTLVDHYRKLRDALKDVKPLICYSMKSNSNLAICKTLMNEGAGFDIVSGGELFKAMKIGADPKKIVYASVGKKKEEIEKAIKIGIFLFNVESLPELDMINNIAGRLNMRVDVAIRINPDVRPRTHKHITTGSKENKFGIDLRTTEEIFDNSNKYQHLNIIGIHLHIGSQIIESAPYVKALKKVIAFIRNRKLDVKILNLGGGLGIIYSKEKPQNAKKFAKAVLPIIKPTGFKIVLEPGRFISGNSGILVTSVVYIKKTAAKKFIIVDAGMNDLIRPSLYDAYHEIMPLAKNRGGKQGSYDIVGPICESGDYLAKNRTLKEPDPYDYLAVMSSGAYGFSMASNYNARPKPAEIMVIGKKFYVVRKREKYDDLIRGEVIPGALK